MNYEQYEDDDDGVRTPSSRSGSINHGEVDIDTPEKLHSFNFEQPYFDPDEYWEEAQPKILYEENQMSADAGELDHY